MSHRPRLVLAGLSGGAGKTILTLGLCRAFAQKGLAVAPFKKGPDYIDAAWLSLAARENAANLDPFLMSRDKILALFLARSQGADISLIEGNRGLFDGKDEKGSCSTSELARTLAAPVVLILDATKMTRTAAAIVKGCLTFEEGLNLAGVILNRTAGARHRDILRRSIEENVGVPVLGMLPKMPENPIPERHMGLISNREYAGQEEILDGLAAFVAEGCDLDRLAALADAAPDLPNVAGLPGLPGLPDQPDQPGASGLLWPEPASPSPDEPKPRIGVVRDAALWFYYPENFEALTRAGAELVTVSLLDGAPWPELDGLYLGGGFPETQAETLAENAAVRERVRSLSNAGLPIYAECGGFMYLCRELHVKGLAYPMAGVFNLATTLCPRPQGLGYSEALVIRDNPFHPAGVRLTGHEFHYSRCLAELEGVPPLPGDDAFCLDMGRGRGMLRGKDGLLHRNTFAAYTHIHAIGVPHWAPNFVAAARRYRLSRT